MEHLSLVSKICTELDNHYQLNDKDLAEFIIDLAENNQTFDAFKKALIENGADSFHDSFISNLLRIIQLMKSNKTNMTETEIKSKLVADKMAMKFPGLALTNHTQDEMRALEGNEKDAKDAKDTKDTKEEKKMSSVADDMMAELEAFAPKGGSGQNETKKVEKRERSRERKSRRDRSSDRSKERERGKDSRTSRRSRSRDKRARSR